MNDKNKTSEDATLHLTVMTCHLDPLGRFIYSICNNDVFAVLEKMQFVGLTITCALPIGGQTTFQDGCLLKKRLGKPNKKITSETNRNITKHPKIYPNISVGDQIVDR